MLSIVVLLVSELLKLLSSGNLFSTVNVYIPQQQYYARGITFIGNHITGHSSIQSVLLPTHRTG